MTANELINLLDRAVKLLEDDNKRWGLQTIRKREVSVVYVL